MRFTLTRDNLFQYLYSLSLSLLMHAFASYTKFCYLVFDKCGQGSTDDELSPTCVSSLLGIQIEGVAAGLWHTVCTSADGDVYAFGGNQFGQLGTGSDQAEVRPSHLTDDSHPHSYCH